MKKAKVVIFIFLFLMFCCVISHADDVALLEDMVLCRHGDGLEIIEEKIHNLNGYKKDSDFFYVPIEPIKAFGFSVAYVGLGGVDLYPGQNITVKGKLRSVKKVILPLVDQKFQCDSSGCAGGIINERQIAIYPHPTDKSLTIIQCLYLGN